MTFVAETVGDLLENMDKDKAMNAVSTIAPAQEGTGLQLSIERALANPDTGIDVLERLLAMDERVRADAEKRAYIAAFRAARSAIRPVVRNKNNDQTRSRYADLEALANAIDPIIDSHGFGMTFGSGIAEKEGDYRVTCDVLHEGGHERHYFVDVPADNVGMKGNQNKTATHGFGSTMSYGRRYLKLMIWDVATTDDNDGQRRHAPEEYAMIDARQCAELRHLIGLAETTEEAFNDRLKVGTLPELAAVNFERAKAILDRRIASKEAAK